MNNATQMNEIHTGNGDEDDENSKNNKNKSKSGIITSRTPGDVEKNTEILGIDESNYIQWSQF